MKIPLLAMLLCCPALALDCPSAGGSGTNDGGLVSYVCQPSPFWGPVAAGPLGSYAAHGFTSVPSEPRACMNFYYNTADGIHNTNETVVFMGSGGGISATDSTNVVGSMDYGSQGMNQMSGTAPPVFNSWVDGSAFAGTVRAGKHLNVVGPCYTLTAGGQLHTAINNSTCSFQVDMGGLSPTTYFYPQSVAVSAASPYVLVLQDSNEQILVSGQSGAAGASYTVTACTRGYNSTAPATHVGGAYAWVADSAGHGTWAPAAACDVAAVLSYLATNMGTTVPGVKSKIWLAGYSEGFHLATLVGLIGHSLITSGTCGAVTDTSWSLLGVFGNALEADKAVVASLSYAGPNSPAPFVTNNAGFEPWAVTMTTGPNVTSPPSVTSIDMSTLRITGLTPTGANSAYLQTQRWSPQYCITGNSANCGVTPDPVVPYQFFFNGAADNTVGSYQAWNYCQTAPNVACRIVAGQGHGAGFNSTTPTGCLGGNGTGAVCSYSMVVLGWQQFMAGPAALVKRLSSLGWGW